MNNGPQSFLSTAVAPVPFAWRTPQETYKGVSGPCDTSGKFMRTQLQEVRYGVQLWTFAVAAPGAPGIVAAGTQRRTFAEVIGDVGVNLGWGTPPLSQQQTNAYPNGSLNNAKEGAFVARSIAFTAQRAFLYDAATGTRLYSDLVDQSGARAARALLEALEFSMLQRDNNVSLNIGPPYLWPSPQQVVEDTYPTTDKANGPAVMLPLTLEISCWASAGVVARARVSSRAVRGRIMGLPLGWSRIGLMRWLTRGFKRRCTGMDGTMLRYNRHLPEVTGILPCPHPLRP